MTRPPWHFWPVTIVALIWYGLACAEYLAVMMEWRPVMSLMADAQRAFVVLLPEWVDGAWAIAVWGGLLGAVLMAFRTGLAPLSFALSAIAMIVLTVWLVAFSGTSAFALTGGSALWVLGGSVLLAVGLWLYARSLHKDGVID